MKQLSKNIKHILSATCVAIILSSNTAYSQVNPKAVNTEPILKSKQVKSSPKSQKNADKVKKQFKKKKGSSKPRATGNPKAVNTEPILKSKSPQRR